MFSPEWLGMKTRPAAESPCGRLDEPETLFYNVSLKFTSVHVTSGK
jgi:hypothetical protein